MQILPRLLSGLLLLSTLVPAPAGATPTVILVPSDGSTVSVNLPAGTYTITSEGTYNYAYGPDCVDACYADAAYSWDSGNGPCYDWPGDVHDLLINDQSPWGAPCDPVNHRYTTLWSCPSACTLEFRIYDLPGTYFDNSGHLVVTIADDSPSPFCASDTPELKLCIGIGSQVVSEPIYAVDPGLAEGPDHQVAGYVDAYRFGLPTGGSAVVPCVTLLVDGVPVNPCAEAGATFVSRTLTLVEEPVAEPQPGTGETLATVAVCNASLTLLVSGFGVEDIPFFVTCDVS